MTDAVPTEGVQVLLSQMTDAPGPWPLHDFAGGNRTVGRTATVDDTGVRRSPPPSARAVSHHLQVERGPERNVSLDPKGPSTQIQSAFQKSQVRFLA